MDTDSLDGSSIDEDLLVSYYPPVYSTEDDYMELIASLPAPQLRSISCRVAWESLWQTPVVSQRLYC